MLDLNVLYNNILFSISGFVSLAVGKSKTMSVEVYSPTGKCNHKLGEFPVICSNPVLVEADSKIIGCCGGQSCWEYNPTKDRWSVVVATAPFATNSQPGVVYEGKVYVMDESKPQVLDPSSNTWSSWPSPPKKPGYNPWMVGRKDTIILIGGSSNLRGIQIFNVTAQTWTVKDSSKVPMDIQWSSSLTLANGNVLVVGSNHPSYYYSAAIYNPAVETWKKLEKTTTNRYGNRVVQLGGRVFAIDGFKTDLVEEFLLETETWKPVNVELLIKRDGLHSLLALPARLFSHLPGGCQGVE